jgi:hypothetical protein
MILFALLVVGIVAAYTACARPNWFWATFACASFLLGVLAAAGNLNPNLIEAGPVGLRVSDPCTLALAIGILYHGRKQGFRSVRRQPGSVMLMLICSFLAIKVVLAMMFGSASIASNGIANQSLGGAVAAVGEVRDSFIGLIAPIYAILAARHLKVSRMIWPFAVAIGAILLVAAIRIAEAGQIWSNSGEVRFLGADEALTLALLGFVLPFLGSSGPGRTALRALAFVAVAVAVLANSRSVWLGVSLGAVPLLLLIVFGKVQLSRDRTVRTLYTLAIALALVMGLAIVFFGNLALQSFSDSTGIGQRLLAITDPARDPDAAWRQELWKARVEQVGDDWLWGRQLGDRRLTLVGTTWVAFPNHNAYVTSFELGGLFLLGLVTAYWGALAAKAVKLLRMNSSPSFSWQPALALVIIAMSLGYSVAYDFPSIGAAVATILLLNASGAPLFTNVTLSYRARQWSPPRARAASPMRTGDTTRRF